MFCTYEHLHVPAFSWIAKSQTSMEDNLFADLSKMTTQMSSDSSAMPDNRAYHSTIANQ
jgi:hypothetical protein